MDMNRTITVGQLLAAVTAWEADVRANRAEFTSEEECRSLPLDEQAMAVVRTILRYVEGGEPSAQTAPQADGSPLEG